MAGAVSSNSIQPSEKTKRAITTFQAENTQLKARLAELEAWLNGNGRNSNRPLSSDGFTLRSPRTRGDWKTAGKPSRPSGKYP